MFGTYQQAGEDSYHKGSLGGMNAFVEKFDCLWEELIHIDC